MQRDEPLERSFILQLKKRLATEASRLHVPAIVTRVSQLPRTHNGKLSEKAARDAANRMAVTNLSALANPESLEEITAAVPEAPV
jgi:acetoacetyl-CoA synthetase